MKLHFIEAPNDGPLRKQIGMADGKDHSFPNAYHLSSYEHEVTVDKAGLKDYRDLLADQAGKGRALMKGLFPRELVCESRAGLIANEGSTRLLVLDVDGIAMDDVKINAGKATAEDVQRVAESVIQLMPEELHDVSYVALASSSFGISATKVSIHIHMFLDTPIDIILLKQWLRAANFIQPLIYDKLTLTKQKIGVKSIVDECLAQQSRIVYIAPPFFGPKIKNPFTDQSARIVLVEKDKTVLDLEPLLESMDELHSWIDEREAEKLEKLQKKAGVSTRKRKMKKLYMNGEKAWVVEDPEKSTLTYHSDSEKLVSYNRPGDKSGPYFVWKSNPEILYSLKPSEPPEMFSAVDPEAYELHVRKFGTGHTVQVVHGKKRRLQHHMFIDQLSDRYHILSHDPDDDVIVELYGKTSQTAEEFLRYKNATVPDPVPTWYIEFDPTDTRSLIKEMDKVIVNKFIPSQYMLDEEQHELAGIVGYGHGHAMMQDCPIIFTIIHHMLGNDDEAFEHFVNWLAFIFQTRQKSGKAWLIHGTNGTGKGLFFNRIVNALFTQHHCKQQSLGEIIDDQFNGWMEHCIVLMIDEFNLENANKSVVATANEFKRMITEPTFSMRKMRVERETRKQHMNIILGSNDIGALTMEDKRRVNVAPRQTVMLDEVFPDIEDKDTFDPLIDKEVPTFARFLKGFKVSVKQARTMLKNDAKVKASEAGLNAAERFFKALKEGDFGVFAEILDTPEDLSLGMEKLASLKHIKKILRASLKHINTNKPVYIHKDDLRRMYNYLSGKALGATGFGRMLTKQEMPMRRNPQPLGYDNKMASRPWCLEVSWLMEDEVMLYELVKANEYSDVPKPQQNGPAPVLQDTM